MLGFQRFQVFIGLALNGSCVILKIGKRYDHDDGGVFDALQEEKGRPEGLLSTKHGELAQLDRSVVYQVQIL